MDPSRIETYNRVFNWLHETAKPRYPVTPPPGPDSQLSDWNDRHTEGNLSPGPSQYWGNCTNVSQTETAPSNPETTPNLDDRSLVEIVGQHAEEMARLAPAAGSIYIGPVPSIQFGYPRGRDPAICFTDTGTGFSRRCRWDLQASAVVNLPDRTSRALDIADQDSVVAAVVYSQLGTNGRFVQGEMGSLNQGLFQSLDGLYRGSHDHDEYIFTTEIDHITGGDVQVATSRYRDCKGTQFVAAVRFLEPSTRGCRSRERFR